MSRFAPVLSLVPALLAAQQPAPRDTTPPIEDNSFLAEEAYNQERGVVQHISSFVHAPGRAWTYTFTQEWPAPSQLHQLSYTVPIMRPESRGQSVGVGDVALNYRYQLKSGGRVWIAPRLTAVLPTGSASHETGGGGTGVQANIPVSISLSPSFVSHTDVGGTLVPRGKTAEGESLRTTNLTLIQSLVWLARPTFNVMLESVFSSTSSRIAGTSAGTDQSLTVSPGVRYAFNFPSGLQIVPGAAVPVTMTGGLGSIHSETGFLLYLSFEHPFGKR